MSKNYYIKSVKCDTDDKVDIGDFIWFGNVLSEIAYTDLDTDARKYLYCMEVDGCCVPLKSDISIYSDHEEIDLGDFAEKHQVDDDELTEEEELLYRYAKKIVKCQWEEIEDLIKLGTGKTLADIKDDIINFEIEDEDEADEDE